MECAQTQAVKTYSEQIFTEYGVKDTQDPNAHVQRTPDGAQIPTPKMPFRERGLYRHECGGNPLA